MNCNKVSIYGFNLIGNCCGHFYNTLGFLYLCPVCLFVCLGGIWFSIFIHILCLFDKASLC